MKHRGVHKLPELNPDGSVNTPLVVEQEDTVRYLHSFAQDTPFFAALRNGKLVGARCPECKYGYGTFKAHCMFCGVACRVEELPSVGTIHSYTVCHYGSEAFLKETPFVLILVEFERFDTPFLSRLKLPAGIDPREAETPEWIGRAVQPKFRKYQDEEPRYDTSDVWFVFADERQR